MKFKTKCEGKKIYNSGVSRSSGEKVNYNLIPYFILKRLAELYTRGAKIHGKRNWEQASTKEDLERFEESALRHMYQWLEGDKSEDHAVAVMFNLAGAELVKSKLK